MKPLLKLIFPAIVAFPVAAMAASAASSLAGSEWGIAGQDMPFIHFEAEGRVAGHAGCNRFFGGYEVNGEAIAIGPLATTYMACLPDVMAAERRFLEALEKAAVFERDGVKLTIRDGAGELLLELIQRDWD